MRHRFYSSAPKREIKLADSNQDTAIKAETDKQSLRLVFAYKAAAVVIMLVGVLWALFFIWMQHWPIAMANSFLAVLGAVSWLLITSGRMNVALIVCELALVVFAIFYSLMFDAPTAEIPRVTHLYLLVLATLGYFSHIRRKSNFQLLVTACSICAFVWLASTHYAFPFAHTIPEEIRAVGIWFNSILATLMMCGGIYLIQREFTRPKGLALELRNAIRRHEMQLHFQPQVDQFGTIIGAEALLRWQHPRRGRIMPGDFIAKAEQVGLMPMLGGWVLEEACRTLARWSHDPVMRKLTLAVNVSACQFQVDDFERFVRDTVSAHKIDPKLLKLELTESVLVHNLSETVAKINNLRETGISFALDDFGTGYSSLSYLRQLPVDQLKVDRSFVKASLESDRGASLVKSIVQLGLDLGFVVLAEGIETPAQHEFLLECGCREFQGYLFGRPMPAHAFADHVRNGATEFAKPVSEAVPAASREWQTRAQTA